VTSVLIVEDNLMNLELMVQLLSDDYEVQTARDGRQGLEMAGRIRPDLILMDLSLPVLDGWEATRRLKGDGRLAHIPVIALTAHAMPGDDERARTAGCDDVLTKPIDEDLLFATLEHHLGSTRGA
jgi:two-component system cell cycle response regulator DivK